MQAPSGLEDAARPTKQSLASSPAEREPDFRPQARLAQHPKDVQLILAEAGRTGAAVPMSELHRDLLVRLTAAGFGDADNAAVIRAFEDDQL